MLCNLNMLQRLNLFSTAKQRFSKSNARRHGRHKQLFAADLQRFALSHVPFMSVSFCLRYNILQDDLSTSPYSYPHYICSIWNAAAAKSPCQRRYILALPMLSINFSRNDVSILLVSAHKWCLLLALFLHQA